MKVLAILSQKGGVGKTTLATALAVAAEADGKTTAVLDLDPQATATFWSMSRKKLQQLETPVVQSLQPILLPSVVDAARGAGTDLLIIDGAAVARDVAFDAAQQADFILVPTRAAAFDTNAMKHTLAIAKQLDKPAAVVLTFVSPQGRETADAVEIIQDLMRADVCPVTMGQRKAFSRAQGVGLAAQEYEKSGAAAKEISALYTYTCTQLYSAAKEPTR